MKRWLLFASLVTAAPAFGVEITNGPIEIYKQVKAAIAKIQLSGKVLQSCPTPIPTNRLYVQLFYVPDDPALRDRAAKEPVSRIELDKGTFNRIVEIPEGDYRIKVMNMKDDKPVGDQKLVVGTKDLSVDLLVDCATQSAATK